MAWQEVGDRVFTWRFPFLDQQIGIVLGGRDVLVIDTRSAPAHAREIEGALRELTRDPVSVVLNTHWHWDHTFGNQQFRPAPIWGHERVVDRLRTKGAATIDRIAAARPELAEALREVEIDPPDLTFADGATIEVGARMVEISHVGRGHTDNDVVAFVPDAAVLFAGDLLENDATPSFGDSYPLEWPATVSNLLPMATGAVVPGHGSVSDLAFVQRQLAELESLAALARRIHAGDLDLDAAIDLAPYPRDDSRQPLERALSQLRGELD